MKIMKTKAHRKHIKILKSRTGKDVSDFKDDSNQKYLKMDNKLTKAELDLLSKAYDISVKRRRSKKDSGVAGSNAIMASEKMSLPHKISSGDCSPI